MGAEDHFAGSEGDAVIGVGCAVIKKLVDFLVGASCCCCLFGADVAEGVEEFVIDGSGVVQESSYNALDTFDAIVVEEVAVVFVWCVLRFGAIDDFSCFGR